MMCFECFDVLRSSCLHLLMPIRVVLCVAGACFVSLQMFHMNPVPRFIMGLGVGQAGGVQVGQTDRHLLSCLFCIP
jgi:hypothetical protein